MGLLGLSSPLAPQEKENEACRRARPPKWTWDSASVVGDATCTHQVLLPLGEDAA